MRAARSFGFLTVATAVFAVGVVVGVTARAMVVDMNFWFAILAVIGVSGLCAVLGVLFSDR